MSGGMSFSVLVRGGQRAQRRGPGGPMRLLVLGDFTGDAGARAPLAARRTHRVGLGSFDDVLRALAPSLRVNLSGSVVNVSIESLDDFHPDRLWHRLPELRAAPASASSEGGQTGLDRLLDEPVRRSPATMAGASPVETLVQAAVAAHVIADPSAADRDHAATVLDEATRRMRTILHDPRFQQLEAAWRGIDWLVTNLELDGDLELHILDVTREELLADIVGAQGQLESMDLVQALTGPLSDDERWSAQIGLYSFGPSDTDVGLLAALGLIAAATGGPFLAGAEMALAGSRADSSQGWQALRRSQAAPSIGLAAPRFLLRLPYGKSTDAIASFAFEELDRAPAHEHFLWGAPALALALLLGRSFLARGWVMEPGDETDIVDLPGYVYVSDGNRELYPCAERFLSDREWDAVLRAGLMPLVSHRHRNAVTVPRFASIAEPAHALAGFGALAGDL
ncbi:MAG TPA: type VI secretion system contractile sheath large subunit [Candidatus Binatia bacterium]|nr:type VI secretion system contractile sheath large subunit [Candidatus Binatia bacterium]